MTLAEITSWAGPIAMIAIALGGAWWNAHAAAHRAAEARQRTEATQEAANSALKDAMADVQRDVADVAKSVKSVDDSIRAHELKDTEFHAKTTQTLELVGAAMKAVAANATDLALIDQRVDAHDDMFDWGTAQFGQLNQRLNEVFRILTEIAHGRTITPFSLDPDVTVGTMAPVRPRRRRERPREIPT